MIEILVVGILLGAIKGESPVTSLCMAGNGTSEAVIDYCRSKGGSLQSRCCYSTSSKDIFAIDLTRLDLNRVPDLDEYTELKNVSLVDLRINARLKPWRNEDFLGLNALNYLFVPLQFPCPGEKHVWQVINQTSDPPGFACLLQKDLCSNSTDVCAELNSYCVTNGPNQFLCLCKPGYFGYKCLRHGQFPYAVFMCTSIVITLVLSGFFYRTQRRYVKRD